MALFYILADTIGIASDPGITLGSANSVIVNTGVLIGSTTSRAITGSGSGHSVTVLGTAAGAAGAPTISLGQNGATDTENSVTVGTSGAVTAIDNNAITVFGVNARVNNQGSIISNDVAVYMDGGAGFFASTVYNSGLIDGRFGGLLFAGSQTVTITNDGTLRSASRNALDDAGTGMQRLYNNGVIDGAVMLGAGNDLYDGRRGVINGTLDGGTGNDTFLMGAGVEVVQGGVGSDTLDFRTTGGIRLALDGAFVNTGTALGDSYGGIEVVNGSVSGADVLRGDAGANVFYGGGGNDVMAGQAGNDALVGGNGADVLNGGLGNDVFVFASVAQGGDTIVDFSNELGNNDFFRIVAAGFGAGLTAGPLAAAKFYATNTNLAHDADDRFIFRTTDKTLWFDANGNAAGGLTMIADLQASATMTAADIVLV